MLVSFVCVVENEELTRFLEVITPHFLAVIGYAQDWNAVMFQKEVHRLVDAGCARFRIHYKTVSITLTFHLQQF